MLQDPANCASSYDGYGVTQAALILFGKQTALSRALPYCQTVLKTPAGHEDLRKNVVETFRDLLMAEQARLRRLAPAVPQAAMRETLVNAYMHRCWRTNGPVIITVADGGIEIENPGDLLPGLHVDNLIYCIPVYRNLLLAEGLRFIALADKIGQGVDIVFKSVICAGLDFPSFDSRENRFSVRFSLEQNAEFEKFLLQRIASLPYLDELVLLRFLWARDEAALPELSVCSDALLKRKTNPWWIQSISCWENRSRRTKESSAPISVLSPGYRCGCSPQHLADSSPCLSRGQETLKHYTRIDPRRRIKSHHKSFTSLATACRYCHKSCPTAPFNPVTI